MKSLKDLLEEAVSELLDGEDLDPELAEHITEAAGMTFIHHPLVVCIHADVPMMNRQANEMLRQKRRMLAEAVAAGEFQRYVFLHERPYRTQAFDEIADTLDDVTYWALAAEVWIDQEDPEDYADDWRVRFGSDRQSRFALMEPDEMEELLELPEVVTVYRADISTDPDGLSWTTNRKVAKFFSRRFGGDHPIRTGTVARENILAYWTRRGEAECLILDARESVTLSEA